jgi:hypothetical protein
MQQSSGEISGPHGGEYEDNSSLTLRRAVWQKTDRRFRDTY